MGDSGGVVTNLAWSPDGKRIVSSTRFGALKVWDAATGQETFTFKGHTGSVGRLAWSGDSRQVVGGDKESLNVWDATTGQKTLTLHEHTGSISTVEWSGDWRIVSSSQDD